MGDYEREQERLKKLMAETLIATDQSNDDEDFDDMPDSDQEDYLETRKSDSDTEQEILDTESDEEAEPSSNMFIGEDKITTWNKTVPNQNVRIRAENLVKRLPISRLPTRSLKHPYEIWKYFINDQMLNLIVENTNKFIRSVAQNYSRENDARPTNITEIQALIGLLYYAGMLKANHLNTKELWATDGSGVEIFRLAMSLNCFRFLLSCLRFDDKNTRPERSEKDKLAPIREFFDLFVENCKRGYSMSEFVTIDEKLEAFRGRCSFRQYIPSKPNKYGIKIFALSDSSLFYTANLEVYVGTQPDGPFHVSNKPEDIVMRLSEPIYNSGRNLTIDNWFTSISLVNKLLTKKITTIGTIRKNKRELPSAFSNPVKRPPKTSMFAFQKECTLVSYIPKKNKNVLLVSSLHHDDAIDLETTKPEIITEYNRTKGGVDMVDQLCSNYNCARNTRRWPMVVFYSSLNVAAINSYVVYISNQQNKPVVRRYFIKELSMEMIKPHLLQRLTLQRISRPMKARIRKICGVEEPADPVGEPLQERGRCFYCDSKRNRKTRYFCKKCKRFMCLEHITILCDCCYEKFTSE